jgi:hypothetical protein
MHAAQCFPSAPRVPSTRVQKKKIWEAVQPDLKTNAAGVAGWKELPMGTSAGPVSVTRLVNGSIA